MSKRYEKYLIPIASTPILGRKAPVEPKVFVVKQPTMGASCNSLRVAISC